MSYREVEKTHTQAAVKRARYREFATKRHDWLEQVSLDPELPKLAYRIAIRLWRLFNLDHGGAAWPCQVILAKEQAKRVEIARGFCRQLARVVLGGGRGSQSREPLGSWVSR